MFSEIDDLDSIYFTTGTNILFVDGKWENQFTTRASFIKALKNNPDRVQYTPIGYNHGNRYNFDFNAAYNKLSENDEYTKRKQAIESKSLKAINKLQTEFRDLRNEKAKLESKKTREIINKNNINKIFSSTFENEIGEEISYIDVKTNPYFKLIKFLVRNGHIDETYSDYMTYFYEFSLSRIDKIFLRSVTDEDAKEFTYELKDPALIVTRLRDIDFDKVETLNFDLLEYLLKTMHKKI
ncbi:hypothetical protein [Paenibacillus macerans]|uniref:hypothetical protein n=1 Tax=Paenibacillus macerans TaxID=44252 RepID=UPI003D31D107